MPHNKKEQGWLSRLLKKLSKSSERTIQDDLTIVNAKNRIEQIKAKNDRDAERFTD
jgi:hypothetical protein